MRILNNLLAVLALLPVLALAQSGKTTPSASQLREVQTATSSAPCLFGMTSAGFACLTLGPGISISGSSLIFTGSGTLPAPVAFSVTSATQTFTMSRGPANGSTLGFLVWRNGLLMAFGSDYTVTQGTGTWTITFSSGQPILVNDIVQVW